MVNDGVLRGGGVGTGYSRPGASIYGPLLCVTWANLAFKGLGRQYLDSRMSWLGV